MSKKAELDEQEKLDKEEYMQKNVAFYQTFLTAWVQNRMEADKQLLVLSSLAIGLLMFFRNELKTPPELIIWLLAGGSFITTIIIILFVFLNNSDYIEYMIAEDDAQESEKQNLEKKLQKQTACAFGLFIIGIILTLVLVVVKSGFTIVKIQGV